MAEEALEEVKIDPNLRCKVCGENEFDLRAGFFYCQECGTKTNQVREIEVDAEAQFRDVKHMKTKKIKKDANEKPKLTSWECYNYVLRGLVEELLQLGAQEELKLVTLQLWSAYLRRTEVAFFSKKSAELPRLGLRFHKRDANLLYNHALAKSQRKKRKRGDESSMVSGDSSRDWRRSKRKLDESLYSATNTSNSESKTSLSSSSTGTTGHAIQLNFSSQARKYLKKCVPAKHLKKHAQDAEGVLKCHNIRPKASSLNRTEYAINTLHIRKLYAILAIALNLVEDDIQLSDLVRFIAEGHIGTKNVLRYFPENVIMYGKDILNDIRFYAYSEKASYRGLREQIQLVAKVIGIQELRKPNLISLAERYVTELNLPPEVATYVERLINLLPPQMKLRSCKVYPAYEARVMAYIVFILKLLFGLDGYKERQISESAQLINEKIHNASERIRRQHPKLFVWNEWVEYIEMRKVIIAQYNAAYGREFRVQQTMSQKLEELGELLQCKTEREAIISDAPPEVSSITLQEANSLHRVMETYKELKSSSANTLTAAKTITFQPSFTPSDSYFKRILLHSTINAEISNQVIKIPEFMRIDHTQRTMQAYLNPSTLRDFFVELGARLHVEPASCTSNRNYVGIFKEACAASTNAEHNAVKANFRITEEKWLKSITDEPAVEEVVFKTVLDTYEKKYMKHLETIASKRNKSTIDELPQWAAACQIALQTRIKAEKEQLPNNLDMLSMHSFDVFNENNMNPIENFDLNLPRRDLDTVDILQNAEVDKFNESSNIFDTSIYSNGIDAKETVTLVTSDLDCWLLLGHIGALHDVKRKKLEDTFPRSMFWLLETCAHMINVDWGVLYEQLMAIETMFGHGIESLDEFKNCIRFKYLNSIKDLNILINTHRDIW